jgi:hypothetical protein
MPLSTVNLPTDQWSHMAITWDTAVRANNVKIYFNGHLTLQATLDAARDKALTIDSLHIGHMGPGQSNEQNFGGLIDELAVYDKVLAAGKIRSYCARVLSAAGAGAPQPVTQRIISQGTQNAGPIYVPKTTFKGRKKMLRVASELISRMLGAKSIAQANLPARVKQWQQTGLDGCVFNITSSERGNLDRYHMMHGQWWALVPRTYEELQPDIKAFQAVKDWGRLTDNFLWSSYAVWRDGPRTKVQDWFNDDHWKIILANVALQARVAKECGFKGILFDVEQYEGHHALGGWHIPFSYPNYSEDGYKLNGESKPRPFDEVAAKIKLRGKQYAQALCAEYPGLKIILIPGLYEWATRLGDGPMENNHCGLYPSFIDGMLTGLDKKATIIGGSELTYSKTRLRDMANIRKEFDQAIDKLCGESKNLQKRLSFSAGVWVDAERKWSDTDESINARNVEEHQEAVKAAFTVSDEYAWLYGEQSKYLGDNPTPLMKRYFKAGVDVHPQK